MYLIHIQSFTQLSNVSDPAERTDGPTMMWFLEGRLASGVWEAAAWMEHHTHPAMLLPYLTSRSTTLRAHCIVDTRTLHDSLTALL